MNCCTHQPWWSTAVNSVNTTIDPFISHHHYQNLNRDIDVQSLKCISVCTFYENSFALSLLHTYSVTQSSRSSFLSL